MSKLESLNPNHRFTISLYQQLPLYFTQWYIYLLFYFYFITDFTDSRMTKGWWLEKLEDINISTPSRRMKLSMVQSYKSKTTCHQTHRRPARSLEPAGRRWSWWWNPRRWWRIPCSCHTPSSSAKCLWEKRHHLSQVTQTVKYHLNNKTLSLELNPTSSRCCCCRK